MYAERLCTATARHGGQTFTERQGERWLPATRSRRHDKRMNTQDSGIGNAGQPFARPLGSVLTCPFCGWPAAYRDSSYPVQKGERKEWWLVQCVNDDCGIWASGPTRDDAADKWNNRTPPAGFQIVSESAIRWLHETNPEAYQGFYERVTDAPNR